jgi:hypothetical protein
MFLDRGAIAYGGFSGALGFCLRCRIGVLIGCESWLDMQMTTLLTIKQHHMSLHCGCGHSAMVSVQELLDRLKPETTVHQVAHRARCKKCGRKGCMDFRLHWKCG